MVGRHFVKIQNASGFIFSRRLDIFMFSTPRKHRDIEKIIASPICSIKKLERFFIFLHTKEAGTEASMLGMVVYVKFKDTKRSKHLTINRRKRIP
jgi:hypothetical protein